MDYSTDKTQFNEQFPQQVVRNLDANRELNSKEVWRCFRLTDFKVLLLNWDHSFNTNKVLLPKRNKSISTFSFICTGSTLKRIKYVPWKKKK